jgi:RNA polymerase sigma-70 factor, ECF subfamily
MRPGLAFMDAALPVTADAAPFMDEDAFRAFYDRTARAVWAYLYRNTRDGAQADDLLQEAYYRLLRAQTAFQSDEHRARYLFRIAANLLADTRRRHRPEHVPLNDGNGHADPALDTARAVEQRTDVARALATLALAYADGASHAEIASHLGVAPPSIKAMLSRARAARRARLRQANAVLTRRER